MPVSTLHKQLTEFKLFKGFTPDEIAGILAVCEIKTLSSGETLISPGIHNNTLFVLLDGGLKVILEKNGAQISISIPPGECLGEMSLVLGSPTSAMVVVHETSNILFIPEEVFWNKLAATRPGVRNLMSLLAMRLSKNNQSLIKEIEEQLKYKHLEKELETAGKIQANILPDGASLFPRHPEVDVYALLNQARDVGGDFYDALALDRDHLYFAIGDASGKGMPAALFMMRTITSLRSMVISDPDFENVIPAVNKMLCKNNDDMMFVSLFAGVLNVRTGVFRYINGGHNPPFISINGGDFELLDVPTGTVLGVLEGIQFSLSTIEMNPGDTLVLYTDGVTEATRADQTIFDVDRTQIALNQSTHNSMKELVHSLEISVNEFVSNAPQHDDLTLLALRYLVPEALVLQELGD